jgi:hypothetical protein
MLLRVNYPAPWRDCLLTLHRGEIMILIGQHHRHPLTISSLAPQQPVLKSHLYHHQLNDSIKLSVDLILNL